MKGLLSFLFFFSPAAQAGDIFTSDSFDQLQKCVASFKSDSGDTMQTKHDRGNIYALNQAKEDGLSCLTRQNDVIAWFKETSQDNFEMTLVGPVADPDPVLEKSKLFAMRRASLI